MELLLYGVGAAFLFWGFYRFAVSSNQRTMKEGRAYIQQHEDPLEFLARPVATLKTSGEIAALNYLVMKPWRETAQHFCPMLIKYGDRESMKTEEERAFIHEMCEETGATKLFAPMMENMRLMPKAIGPLEYGKFSAWCDANTERMKTETDKSVGTFMCISSVAAAEAIICRFKKEV